MSRRNAVVDRAFDAAVGRRVMLTRKSLHVSQPDLASAIGVSQQTMSNYELGCSSIPPVLLARIAAKLGVSAGVLIPKIQP
jgi:transcriptional regulator with XRE-family HTH domain